MPSFDVTRLLLLVRRLRPVPGAPVLTGEAKISSWSFGASISGLEIGESSNTYLPDDLDLGVIALNLDRPFPLPSGVAWMRYVLSRTRCKTGSLGFWFAFLAVESLMLDDGGANGEDNGVSDRLPARAFRLPKVLPGVLGVVSCNTDVLPSSIDSWGDEHAMEDVNSSSSFCVR
jgi:hypothetical protein